VAQTTGGEIEAESDDGDRSSADSLFDEDASKSVEEVAYPSVPPGSAIYRVFSPDQASQWFKAPPFRELKRKTSSFSSSTPRIFRRLDTR
jgi:hypothetical protein